jgi:putative restriction endonuclease
MADMADLAQERLTMPDELPEFDAPVFKRLARNDTGQAAGHQGGLVIPQALDSYFPQLVGATTSTSPTVDRDVRATLVVRGAASRS